jgi:formylmethanofuran dehydrogenase subunit B
MREAEKPKGAVAQQIRKELSSDPIIQLVPRNKKAASVADVTVASKVSLMEMKGVNRKTGKPGKMTAVVMEATITSQSPPAIYTVYESGHVLQNEEVSKRFAKQIRQVILEKVGPQIPAH